MKPQGSVARMPTVPVNLGRRHRGAVRPTGQERAGGEELWPGGPGWAQLLLCSVPAWPTQAAGWSRVKGGAAAGGLPGPLLLLVVPSTGPRRSLKGFGLCLSAPHPHTWAVMQNHTLPEDCDTSPRCPVSKASGSITKCVLLVFSAEPRRFPLYRAISSAASKASVS